MRSPLKPLGSYIAGTPLSRVDARVKLVLLLLATAVMFAAPASLALPAGVLALAGSCVLARLSPRQIARAARPVTLLLAFTLCANLISCDGHGSVALAGPVGFDPAGGLRGMTAVLRILLLFGMALTVSASTTAQQMSDACVRLMRPLGRVGVPVAQLGSALSLALRFVPIVSEEFQRIRCAQTARGVRFDQGSIIERVRRYLSVFTPLIVGLLRRADRLADSMAARCYADGSGAQVPALPLSAVDRVLLAGAVAVAGLLLAAPFWLP